jgi:hypothetical protein
MFVLWETMILPLWSLKRPKKEITNRADRSWVGADSNRMKTVLLGRFAPSAGYLFQDSNPPDACVLRRGILAPLTVFVALLG